MTLDYYDVMNADLSSLVDASEAWNKMGERFGELRTNYKQHVRGLIDDGSWTGVSAIAFEGSSNGTLHEFQGAKNQAIALGKLLKDAHTTLSELKEGVKTARQEAIDGKMKVDAYGYCTYDFDKFTADEAKLIRRDLRGQQETERSWTEHISKAVKKVADADEGTKRALKEATKDEDGKGESNGFNSKAMGDIEKYEAKHAAELGTKLNSGEELSKTQMADFQRLMRDNSDDTAYSRTLLNRLGADGVVKLTNSLNGSAYVEDSARKKGYINIEKGLASVLATATSVDDRGREADERFYRKWRAEMKKIGTQEFDGPLGPDVPVTGSDQKIRGYQSIMTLMESGDPEDYSPKLLQDLGNDIYEAEKESKGNIWDVNQAYSGKEMSWFANDPMDSALGIMSHHPGAATTFLDPGPGTIEGDIDVNDGKGMLDYLLKDRDWNGVVPEYEEWGKVRHGIEEGEPGADIDARVGLGAALEAATTGEEPLGDGEPPRADASHTTEQARVMQRAIHLLDPGMEGSPMPENLQVPVANSLADYAPDTHQSLDRANDMYRNEIGIQGAHDDARMIADPGSLVRVMRGVSDSPEAFAVIHQSEREQIMQDIDRIRPGTPETDSAVTLPMEHAAKSLGAFDAIRQDVITDLRDERLSEADWNAKVGYHVVGGAFTPIPVVGDGIQRAVDTWTWNMSNEIKEDATNEANGKIAEEHLKSEAQIRRLVGDWGESEGMDRDSAGIDELQEETMLSRNDARDAAIVQLGNEDY